MHLLAAQAGAAQQEGEAIDLGQTPADILFLSAADSELMMLASAADRAGADNLRLARILNSWKRGEGSLFSTPIGWHVRMVRGSSGGTASTSRS